MQLVVAGASIAAVGVAAASEGTATSVAGLVARGLALVFGLMVARRGRPAG